MLKLKLTLNVFICSVASNCVWKLMTPNTVIVMKYRPRVKGLVYY
jgi:hypothetical protein